ncbi:unnamed protein product [Macrosiphum euphorbiae]|uniref:DDE Tnp4 domain-containing protein n=1 Tax=Macrosiphum euphorbiae TaxID=13131 RepID=A0AAV0VUQ3_9HEMI|nr:unnamed protein product [Macrosiphum euphorbiae]
MLYHITVFSRLSTIIPKGCVILIKMDCGRSSSSSGWEEELEAVAAFVVLDEEENKTKTREWVHAINKKRETLGEFHRLVPELKKDTKRFHMYFRMTMEEFDFLHELIKPDIYKQNTQFRRAVSTEERLAVCLRFLATGNSFRSIGFNYRLGFSTVREIVKEVCDAIWNRLGPIVMPPPTEEIRNYLGDNEPNKIFNYRLSRARPVVENAFGILAARWRCFRGHLEVQPEIVDKIVLASCCLHNMLCADNAFEPDNESLQLPEAALLNLDPLRRNSTREAFQVREKFRDYFNSDAGSVVWQVESVRKGRIHS